MIEEIDPLQGNVMSVELQGQTRQLYQEYAPTISNEVIKTLAEDPLSLFTPDTFFELKFKRLYKDHDDNLNSFKTLNRLLKSQPISFSTDRISDLTALIGAYHDWRIEIDGSSPRHLLSYEDKKITSGYSKGDVQTVYHEHNILDVLRMASEEDCFDFIEGLSEQMASYQKSKILNKQQIVFGSEHNRERIYKSLFSLEDKQAESFQKVAEGLKGLKEADESRLIGLWLWDNIEAGGYEDHEEGFQEVYATLVEKLNDKNVIQGPWEQYTINDARARKYLQTTDNCIQSMTVLNLGS